jgi:hypothetical protein
MCFAECEVPMSRDSSYSRWNHFVREAHRRWPHLSEQDFQSCRVERSQLVRKLQEVYGMSASTALKEICEIERSLNQSLCTSFGDVDLEDLWPTVYENG